MTPHTHTYVHMHVCMYVPEAKNENIKQTNFCKWNAVVAINKNCLKKPRND